jgi:acyl carrier protein
MTREIVEQQLQEIFEDAFEDPSIRLRDEMTAADVDGWDSLSHIDLIVAVEKRFRIRLTTGEVRGLNNVGDFIALISRKAA